MRALVILAWLLALAAPAFAGQPPTVRPHVTVIPSSGTWTKPPGITWVRVWAYPGGTGGTVGFLCPVLQACAGPGGAGGGSVGYWEGPASSLPATVPATVGAGGAGGSSGNPGGAYGGVSSFGIYAVGLPGGVGSLGFEDNTLSIPTMPGSGGGLPDEGWTTYQTIGTAANYYAANAPGMYLGAAGATSLAAASGANGSSAMCGGPGAGSGGSQDGRGTIEVGGAGGSNMEFTVVAPTNPAPSLNGTNATGRCMGGGGQGGSSGVGSTAARAGGAGGFPGGAGGSGGDGTVGEQPAGNGGAGANGEILVETW